MSISLRLILDDDDVEFEGFTPEDIRGRPVDLINSCHDRQIVSRQPHRSSGWANHCDFANTTTKLAVDLLASWKG